MPGGRGRMGRKQGGTSKSRTGPWRVGGARLMNSSVVMVGAGTRKRQKVEEEGPPPQQAVVSLLIKTGSVPQANRSGRGHGSSHSGCLCN